MNIEKLIERGLGVTITLTSEQLIEVIDYVVEKTRIELENEIRNKNTEIYLTSKEVCDFLNIDNTTLWRWDKRGYLTPIYIGGKKRYPKSEIEKRFTINNN